MMRAQLLLYTLLLQQLICEAQSAPIWTATYGGVVQLPTGIIVDESCQHVVSWGSGSDTNCFNTAPAFAWFDTAGNFINDTLLDVNYCATELPKGAIKNNGCGIYVSSEHNVITPQDSSFIYRLDSNFQPQWFFYGGERITSNILHYRGSNYYSSDLYPSGMNVNKFNSVGTSTVLNAVTLSYYPNAPHTLLASGSWIFEIGSRSNNSDTAFVCQIYDTTGIYNTTFSFDADAGLSETVQHVSVCNGQLFNVCYQPSTPKTFVASCGLTGSVNWKDTLSYSYRSACTDSINNFGYVLCNTGAYTYKIFAYDLFAGTLLDSMFIDSANTMTGLKTGPAGGVYFLYTNQFTGEITLEQYDENLDWLWTGIAQHPSCSGIASPRDFVIDGQGYGYVMTNSSSCPDNILVAKFAPSLVSIPETIPEQHISLFPNPANDEVRIQLSGQSGNNSVNILNALGEVVRTDKFTGTTYQMSVDRLPSGVYFVQVITESGSAHAEKLIIQR